MEMKTEVSVRLDAFLASNQERSRSQIAKDIKAGACKVNGKVIDKPSYTLKIGDSVEYEPVQSEVRPVLARPKDDVELNYVYRDKDIAIINKPRGMVVHPAPGHYDDTLVNYLLTQDDFDFDKEDSSTDRPGIVHRIDKDTQGILAVAMNGKSQANLQEQIKNHEFHRYYLALVWGDVRDRHFKIDAPLTRPNHTDRRAKVDIYNGREAITHCTLLGSTGKVSLLLCRLETGRTHQIRAHLNYIGFPIVGDPLYGKRELKVATEGQALTAFELTLTHPSTGKSMTFYAPIDEYFKKLLRYFFRA